ncbi:DNA cytosine methyltransferase [bacterium]|nr:DNA cytosine methyltransferase [bacterium]
MKKIKLSAIDFFCGAGGMTCGMRKAGIDVIAGIDIDPECKETYEANNTGTTFIEKDITIFSPEELKAITKIKKHDDNLVFIGCSPCQYWTHINTDRSKGSKSKNLLADFQRFVDYFKPGYIVIENVPGILNRVDESPLPHFIKFLNENLYVVEHRIINTHQYGVPQKRRRFLLIASRVKKKIKWPKARKEDLPVVRDFIGPKNGFKKIPAGYTDPTNFLHSVSVLSEKNLMRIRQTPHNGGTRLAWKNDSELQIDAYKGKDKMFSDIYGRMFWDKPAPTITTKFYSISNGRFGHPDENRGLSLREGATLQTFPRKYVFKGPSKTSIARQIGNAVPPELAKRIGIAIIS